MQAIKDEAIHFLLTVLEVALDSVLLPMHWNPLRFESQALDSISINIYHIPINCPEISVVEKNGGISDRIPEINQKHPSHIINK